MTQKTLTITLTQIAKNVISFWSTGLRFCLRLATKVQLASLSNYPGRFVTLMASLVELPDLFFQNSLLCKLGSLLATFSSNKASFDPKSALKMFESFIKNKVLN